VIRVLCSTANSTLILCTPGLSRGARRTPQNSVRKIYLHLHTLKINDVWLGSDAIQTLRHETHFFLAFKLIQ
jgi:hypothetical protein